MLWDAFAVLNPLTDRQIAESLAAAFGVGSQDVALSGWDDDLPATSHVPLHARVRRQNQGFRVLLEIHAFFAEPPADHQKILMAFAAWAKTEVMTGDETVNPYAYYRIRASGEIEPVRLVTDKLDADDFEFHIQ